MSSKKSPFDYVKAISETKEDFFDEYPSDYSPFVINKALSFNLDCVFLVHEMSKYPILDNKSQFNYLLNSIDKAKRYGKWVKKDSLSSDIAIIKEAYGYSDDKALAVLDIISDKDILQLKELLDKGGRK